MRKIFRSSATGIVSWGFFLSQAIAMSQGPIVLDIRQVDGKPAACMPTNNDQAAQTIQIRMVGVSRATGPVSPDVIYWGLEVPESAKPVYLKRGECLVYGQTIDGAVVDTPPKALDVNKSYDFAIIPVGNGGPVYGAGFCVLKGSDGTARVAVPQETQNPCSFTHAKPAAAPL